MTLHHGGNLQQASQRYGIPVDQWIDLSTGINPRSYPLAPIDTHYFQRLPYPSSDLEIAAAQYYGSDQLMAIAGTQAAIQVLPVCLPRLPIWLPKIGYQEHRKYWLKADTACHDYPADTLEETVSFIDRQLQKNAQTHMLLINPNNPTGLCFDKSQLLQWADRLEQGGHLIVDEAFMDASPEQSLLTETLPDNVLVLRSCGKFFGLAGIRLGFAFGDEVMRERLAEALGLWSISGPTQAAGVQALSDSAWQHQARLDIARDGDITERLFAPLMMRLKPVKTMLMPLFHSYLFELAVANRLQSWFAERGILLRLIEVDGDQILVRIGLVDSSHTQHCQRLQQAITTAVEALDDGVFYTHETALPQKA